MAPSETLWELEPHTRGKHLVLKNYMGAWLPIMLFSNDRALFIDAFAGPGEYRDGEEGSPVIALKALCERADKGKMRGSIDYMFIEKDAARASHLEKTIAPILSQLPDGCDVGVYTGTFTETMSAALDAIDSQNDQLAPSFVMIDPFGVSGTPMSLIERILKNDKAEVFITFMYGHINRFKSLPEFEKSLDNLFGCADWREGIEMPDSNERKAFFYALYKKRLRESGARFVLDFDVYEGGSLVYALFFATKNELGCDKMKQAMWKAAPDGDFRFKGGMGDQLTFGTDMVDFGRLRDELRERFGIGEWLSIESAQEFMRSDRTLFHSGQLKRVLADMETGEELEADPESERSRRRFPEGTRFRLVNTPPPPKQARLF